MIKLLPGRNALVLEFSASISPLDLQGVSKSVLGKLETRLLK